MKAFKGFSLFLIFILLTVSVISCSEQADHSSKSSDPAVLTINDITIGTIEAVDESENSVRFIDEKAMNTEWNVLINIPCSVSSFEFFSINIDYLPDSSNTPVSDEIIEEVLFEKDSIPSGTPIIISTYINDAVATRGISFIDSNGNNRYFYINFNAMGEGDELYLSEFYLK